MKIKMKSKIEKTLSPLFVSLTDMIKEVMVKIGLKRINM